MIHSIEMAIHTIRYYKSAKKLPTHLHYRGVMIIL